MNIHVPLPRNVLLLYSDCCVYTCYPDNFCSLMPFFNHITTRVMYYCSIAFTKSVQLFHYSNFVWFKLFKHVPSLNFLFFLSPAQFFQFSAVIFYRRNFSKFCRIHLKFSLTFQIPYLASILYVSLLHLSGSTGSLHPLLDTGWYITSPD